MSNLYDPGVESAVVVIRAEVASRQPPGNPTWERDARGNDGDRWVNRTERISMIWSCARQSDNAVWLHVSVGSPDKLPSWWWLRSVKEWVAGDRYAYQVLPPKEMYVNIHENVLHLFSQLGSDGPPLPEFSGIIAGQRSL